MAKVNLLVEKSKRLQRFLKFWHIEILKMKGCKRD